jgi:hypothetical protein
VVQYGDPCPRFAKPERRRSREAWRWVRCRTHPARLPHLENFSCVFCLSGLPPLSQFSTAISGLIFVPDVEGGRGSARGRDVATAGGVNRVARCRILTCTTESSAAIRDPSPRRTWSRCAWTVTDEPTSCGKRFSSPLARVDVAHTPAQHIGDAFPCAPIPKRRTHETEFQTR